MGALIKFLQDPDSAVLIIFAFIVFLVLVFTIFRFVLLWYWRVNELVDTNKAILAELKKSNEEKAGAADTPR